MTISQTIEALDTRLNSQVGQPIIFKNKRTAIESWEFDAKNRVYAIKLETGRTERVYSTELHDWLDRLAPAQPGPSMELQAAAPIQLPTFQVIGSPLIGELTAILRRNIEGIMDGTLEIEKARAVREQVDTVLDIAKIEISAVNAISNFQKA
jgi:hypothetical protein